MLSAATAAVHEETPVTTQTTSPPYESVDPRAWYPAVREAVPLERACREYLTAVEFNDEVLIADPRMPEGERRQMECIANLAAASAAELAMAITPERLGRQVAHRVLELDEPKSDWRPPADVRELDLPKPTLGDACREYLAIRRAVAADPSAATSVERALAGAVVKISQAAGEELAFDNTVYVMGLLAEREDIEREGQK